MLHHRTTNNSIRAEHIANRLEKEHGCIWDWPYYWLAQYRQILKELTFNQD